MIDEYGVPEILNQNIDGNLKLLYEDIKYVLKVPIVNFIFRTTALYEDFLSMAWREVRPNMLTCEMEKAAETLRYPAIPKNIPSLNWNEFYSRSEIKHIRKIIFTFNYVNTKLLLIAAAWYESLSNRQILPKNKKIEFIEPGIIPILPEIHLINMKEASQPLKYLYKDIIDKHQSLDISSDFRALANYPYFLESSWSYLRNYVGTNNYNLLSSNILNKAVNLVHEMPYPMSLNRELLSHFYTPSDIAGIMGTTTLFLNFLPKLIIDGEFFRQIMVNSLS